MRTLSHDGFARQSTVKSEPVDGSCDWCGNGTTAYQYGTAPDDSNRINWHRGLFCSKGCHDSYHS